MSAECPYTPPPPPPPPPPAPPPPTPASSPKKKLYQTVGSSRGAVEGNLTEACVLLAQRESRWDVQWRMATQHQQTQLHCYKTHVLFCRTSPLSGERMRWPFCQKRHCHRQHSNRWSHFLKVKCLMLFCSVGMLSCVSLSFVRVRRMAETRNRRKKKPGALGKRNKHLWVRRNT